MFSERHNPASIAQFETAEHTRLISWKLFWTAIVVAFVIANAPPNRVSPVILGMLQVVPHAWVVDIFHDQDFKVIADRIVLPFIVSLKKFFFFLALIVICFPIVGVLCRSASFWERLGLKRLAVSAGIVFVLLSMLTIPYAVPHGQAYVRSGLSGLGFWFGEMSLAPFSFDLDVYYGRLLKPALSHYFHLSGYTGYYLFSLICTYLLVFLTLTFLESKILIGGVRDGRRIGLEVPALRWVVYFSVMTSSFIMVSFQGPGKVDDLAFIFILAMATLPMTAQARLGLLALCALTHEAITLALLPVIMFWFPRGEQTKALLVIGLFFAIMTASYGFDVSQEFVGHGSVLKEGSVWQVAIAHPGYLLAAVFFTYKLWWGLFLYMLWRLWARDQVADVKAVASTIGFPLLLCLLAWDTTRIAGVGFLGMLAVSVLVMKEAASGSATQSRLLMVTAIANLMIPSYQIILFPPVGEGPPVYMDTHSTYPYLGLYKLIHTLIHSWAL